MNNNETVNNTEILTLDDIYFKDAFTKTEDKLNLEVDNANISCLSSKNNKFSLDEDGNLVVNSITYNESNIPEVLNIDQIYPVGSIYMSTTNTNPSTIFGGTWEQIKDRFLLSAGDTYEAGSTGGEASHTLTIEEMPRHSHELIDDVYNTAADLAARGDNGGSYNRLPNFSLTNSYSHVKAANAGGNKPHENMPPYLTVYMWKRTA